MPALPRLLQFNYESTVSYNDDGFTTLSVKGTLEIPLTRDPNQAARSLTQTADMLRDEVRKRIMSSIDLVKFRFTRRNFTLSRDKRTLTWDFIAEEIPYMSMPVGCTVARGSFNVRPSKAGPGLVSWMCTLRATYTVRADEPRRIAWLAFLALLRQRMSRSSFGNLDIEGVTGRKPKEVKVGDVAIAAIVPPPIVWYNALVRRQNRKAEESRIAWLMDFSFDEGLYLDSKITTFSASWRLNTTFSHILLASGLWHKTDNPRMWAASVQNIQGVQSWSNAGGPMKPDIIVDFGGGQ